MRFDHYRLFFVCWVLFVIILALGRTASGATPGVHHFDPKFSLEYAASWNAKHPKAPITDMACYYFSRFSPKQAGVPDNGAIPVPAHEDCMVAERYGKRILCGEINIKPTFQAGNPDGALLAGTRLQCKGVRAAIASARNHNEGTA